MRNLIIGNHYGTCSNANLIIKRHSRKMMFKLENNRKNFEKYRVVNNRRAQEYGDPQ